MRDDNEYVAHERLPRRWVELIHHLNEHERHSVERSEASNEHALLAEAELAVSKQAALLRELLRTEEPTEEATALLECLRANVARALARRN